jgi:cell filamentation protein
LLTGARYAFDLLVEGPLLRGRVDDDEFLVHASVLLGNLNYLHPFREGNGRSQRAFLDLVAEQSGHVLTWRNVSEEENVAASAASVADPNTDALRAVLAKAIQPPFDRRPVLDDGIYRAGAPMTVAPADATAGGLGWLHRASEGLPVQGLRSTDDDSDGDTAG